MKLLIKPWIKSPTKQLMKPLVCSTLLLSIMLSLLGCQQTQITFTPTAKPQLPVFDKLQGAPEIAALDYQASAPAERLVLSPELKVQLGQEPKQELELYLFNDTPSGLTHLSLVAYSKAPMANLDVLVAAFREKRRWIVQQSSLACAETLSIRVSMHSLTISIDCPYSPSSARSATKLLMQFWQAESPDRVGSFDEIDIANVRRQLKLAKHINAYSGAEIDQVWAKKLLGEQHVYNQALNDKALADELDLTKLNQVRDTILAQSKWAFFANNSLERAFDKQPELDFNNSPEQGFNKQLERGFNKQLERGSHKEPEQSSALLPMLNKQFETIATQQSQTLTPFPTAKNHTAPSNDNKTLYLIDAPASVQTQVRIGYPLDASDNNIDSIQDCKLLASWLGRSFSGRLYYDLREVRGLTYGIYGRCFNNPLSRTLKFYGSTKLEHTGAFISGVLDHLALAAQTPASNAEVTALKNYLTSQKMLYQANYHNVELDSIKRLILGYQPEQEQQTSARLAGLTPEQLQQIARSIFTNTPYIVIRGDMDKIKSDLTDKLPEWTITEVSAD
ncbi:pitrilysin family protein [uncultured Shewanella sp.]|uniref:M16 family metallopeptidase n=1 Tax=uncultured Shewanella sp. TaxID=173975 RepID=UPI002604064D|nr:insulinase family protein [uncultured Shewanella sp.]